MSDLDPALARRDDIPRCLSFSVSGPWAHFRQISGNSVRRTYRAPPRTTVAGLIAAIIGRDRDSYYGLFQPDASALAISPETELRTQPLPENLLTTSHEGKKSIKQNRTGLKVSVMDSSKARQRQNFEVLSDVSYRVDCWLADDDAYAELEEHLSNDTSVYTPSLGLSEFLADIEYHGSFEPESIDDDVTDVVSTVPGGTANLVPTPESKASVERTPAVMETTDPSGPDGAGRRTTAFADIAVESTGGDLRTTAPAAEVDGRAVVFL